MKNAVMLVLVGAILAGAIGNILERQIYGPTPRERATAARISAAIKAGDQSAYDRASKDAAVDIGTRSSCGRSSRRSRSAWPAACCSIAAGRASPFLPDGDGGTVRRADRRPRRDRRGRLRRRAVSDRDRRRRAGRVDGDARGRRVPRPQKSSLARGESGAVAPTDVEWFLEGDRARGASPATLRSYGPTFAPTPHGSRARRARNRRAAARRARLRVRLAGRGLAPASRARALSALRSLHRRLARLDAPGGSTQATELLRDRAASAACRTAPREAELARLLDETLSRGTAAACATARRSSCSTAAACASARRAGLDRGDVDARAVRVLGKGGKGAACGGTASRQRRRRRRVGRPRAARRRHCRPAATRCCSASAVAASRRRPSGASSTAG